ncbi:ZrgA family zinc uptake protein [Marinobacter zhejiangensis]|uniref:DUF2796 domain-containing protein n=1 Tax=Marinobacter zhejiangensis TaxID=488535 RepID=A0A1I4SIT9_9GAMM|nr:DUF2796 domain-containing protein [Marinobacter zhejiangensis]SFM64352.1 Protein of unknown function [Marinobacter zhejiangensis]
MRLSRPSPLYYILPLATLPAFAADNPAAHQHGHATLQVVMEGPTLSVLLDSPAHNLLGFEHRPVTADEHHQLNQATEWLTTTPLLTGNGIVCEVQSADVATGLNEDDHEHSEHHSASDLGHFDVEVTQQISCNDQPDDGVWTSPLTEQFEHMQQLDVEWISPQGQGASRLTSRDRSFRVTP